MKHLFITFAAVLLSFLSVAQNGVLKGEISTLESGMMETMPFAVVQVAGSTMGTRRILEKKS